MLGRFVIAALLLAGCAGPAAKAPYYWCQPLTVKEEPGLLCAPVHPKAGTQEVRR